MKTYDDNKIPNGFICNCGLNINYPLYVYAHWNNEIFFTCPECKRIYQINRGVSILVKVGGYNEEQKSLCNYEKRDFFE